MPENIRICQNEIIRRRIYTDPKTNFQKIQHYINSYSYVGYCNKYLYLGG